jgi:hypothetical protein
MPGQTVWADLDGRERRVEADKWDDETKAVEVLYPPGDPSVAPDEAGKMMERTRVSSDSYRPNDPQHWPVLFA